MALLPQLPRSLPISAKHIRLLGAILGTLVLLHVLHLLPGTSPLASSSGRALPLVKTGSVPPRRQEPEHVQKYLDQVLQDARKKASMPHNRIVRQDPLKAQPAKGADAQAHLDSETRGNTLVLATHSDQAALGVIAVRHELLEDAQAFIPGINTGAVKTWLPSSSGWLNDAKGTSDIDGLVGWIDSLRDNLKTQGHAAGKRLGDTAGGIGGIVLGSCERDLPLLTPSLLELHARLPSTLRFPVVCMLPDPASFLDSSPNSLPEWSSATVLGAWSQIGAIRILAPAPALTIASLSAHFTRLSHDPSLAPLAYEHIPISSFVPSLALPPTFKRAAWRDGKKMFGGGSQGIKRQGKKPTLVDAGVIDDGTGKTAYQSLFASLEAELDAAPSTWGYLKPASRSAAFSPDPSPKARSQFLLHVILPPPTVVPWSAGSTPIPSPPEVPERLAEVVKVHWEWKATPEESIPTQFWKAMDELDILLLADESTPTHLPPGLPLSLSLSIPLLYPSSPLDSSTSFPFTLAKPHALPTLSAVRLLRTGTGEGVEMGTHWNLRREVLALLERGWAWKEARKGGSREDNWVAVIEALG